MKYSLSLIVLLLTLTASSQEYKTISGTVYYQENQKPVPFAYVKLKDIAFGTVTEYDGSFSLRLPEKFFKEELEFSYTGLEKVTFDLSEYREPLRVFMTPSVTELYTVVITAKRAPNPKSILRKALKAVSDNFLSESFKLAGYYREYVTENERPVKYADALFQLDLEGYSGKMPKKKFLENPVDLSGATTVGSWMSRSSSLHRWHFHQQVVKGERAKIIEVRSSDDLNSRRMYSNIQGGPLSALTKDRVKYPANFMDDFGKYDYEVLTVQKKGEDYYLLRFSPDITAEELKEKKMPFNYEQKLSGEILIRRKDYLIEEISYSVPPELKQYICGYRGWNVRHFDFSVKAKYEKTAQGYALSYLKHADEFIIEDTLAKIKIPYAAISEFFMHDALLGKSDFSKEENFANSDYNYLFDEPEAYNKSFWDSLESIRPECRVPTELLVQLSAVTPLEKQFANKLTRDTTMTPPVAKEEEHTFILNGETITDEYAWLKDTKNPMGNEEVMQYLAAENAYTDNYFKPMKPVRRELFKELKSYVQEDFTSLPIKENGYEYYYRYFPEKDYPIYYRKNLTSDSAEFETLFDVNQMAEDHGFYSLTGIEVSPNNLLAAFLENTSATDRWTLRFKNLETKEILPLRLDYAGQMEWINDQEFFYVEVEKGTYRSNRLYHYSLATGRKSIVFEELDKTYSISIGKSLSKEFLFLNAGASDQNEIQFLRLSNPEAGFQVIAPRRPRHRYDVTHFEDKFYILSNHKAINNKLLITDTSRVEEKYWKTLLPHDKEVELLNVVPFKKWMVFQERHGLKYKVRVENREDGKSHFIKQGDQDAVFLADNRDFDTDTLQINKSNYRYPSRIQAYHMDKKKFKTLKVLGKISPMYFTTTEVVYAKAKDGTEIPITLIYPNGILKAAKKQGKKPTLFITGYGSYGSRNTPSHSPNLYPLLQKGVVYAIAHVRGGGDLGEGWYLDGKMLNKKNTFTDFIACTEFLIEKGYGEKGKVIAQGGSAGGLLMGAIANMRPDLYKLIILDVPFVDVINTMLDDKLPLTTGEYSEWGNPNEKKYFKYISSYSPYENVSAQKYPMMLFLTAINDTRVGYWEPAKMVARLRKLNQSGNEIFLKTDFSAGHGGASGRYNALLQTAFKYSLILETVENLRKQKEQLSN